MVLVLGRTRGVKGVKIIVTRIDDGSVSKFSVCNFVKTFYYLNDGSNFKMLSEEDHILHLRRGKWVIVDLTGGVSKSAWVDNRRTSFNNSRVNNSGIREGEGGGGLVAMHIFAVLGISILLHLALHETLSLRSLLFLLLETSLL